MGEPNSTDESMQDWETISPLVAGLYEAAVYPELWQKALTAICDATDFKAAFMFSSDGSNESSVVTPSGAEVFNAFVEGGWQGRNERMFRMLAKGQHGFIQDLDVFTPDEIAASPVHQEFLVPLGLGIGAGTFVQSPNSSSMILSLDKPYQDDLIPAETMELLDMIRPHLARAVMLTIEVQKRQTELTLTGLSSIGVPAAAIGQDLRIVAANHPFEALESQIFFRAGDRITLKNKGADILFTSALMSIGADAQSAVRSIPIPATETDPASVVHLLPLRREARSFCSDGSAIVFVSQAANEAKISHSLLRGLYDLTNGEAKVAECILGGLGLKEASVKLGIAYETVRTIAKGVFAKTGSSGQADLVRRISFLQRV
jgi:DNA-binding CsgD family transcriptional regulator